MRVVNVATILLGYTAMVQAAELPEFAPYCIIGAGPGGLQVAHLLQAEGAHPVVFERASRAGSFFEAYPRHRKLISSNKVHTGVDNMEFNLRHDWNSLLDFDDHDEPVGLHGTASSALRKQRELQKARRFGNWSKEYFPPADRMVDYLGEYARRHQLDIRYGYEVVGVTKAETPREGFILHVRKCTTYLTQARSCIPDPSPERPTVHCIYVVVATGMQIPNGQVIDQNSDRNSVEGYEAMPIDPANFTNQRVAILGNGNSAFETADHLASATALVHIYGRRRVRLAWETHYVGDVRAVNNHLLDSYQLKSLDALIEMDASAGSDSGMSFNSIKVRKTENGNVRIEDFDRAVYESPDDTPESPLDDPEGKVLLEKFPNVVYAMAQEAKQTEIARNREYDRVIRCLGWRGDLVFLSHLHKSFRDNTKFASVDPFFESKVVPNLFFAGQLSHGRDWRESAGGFIHGFRYLARALARRLLAEFEGIPWPKIVHTFPDDLEYELLPLKLADIALGRLNQASGTYQMFGQLEDMLVFPGGPTWDCTQMSEAALVLEVPKSPSARAAVLGGETFQGYYVTIGFQYGANFSYPACTRTNLGCDVFKVGRVQVNPDKAHLCNFLHPVLRLYSTYGFHGHDRPIEEFHLVEDLLTFFTLKKKHIEPLVEFFGRALKF